VNQLKGDGERGFNQLRRYFKFISDSSPFTNHNKTIDRVIRTIRDAVGYRIITEKQLNQIIYYYNNSYHRSIDCNPQEMQDNPDLEDQYIRWCIEKLNEREEKLYKYGLYSYRPGNILLLYVDESKTPQKQNKTRSYWNKIGEFIAYEGKSKIRVKLINTDQVITLPLYYTKFLANNINYLRYYDTSKYDLLLS
jgi:hypothetical protein